MNAEPDPWMKPHKKAPVFVSMNLLIDIVCANLFGCECLRYMLFAKLYPYYSKTHSYATNKKNKGKMSKNLIRITLQDKACLSMF